MRKFFMVFGAVLMVLTATGQADALISTTLTADNHYGLYYGQGNGSGLTLVGRNEFGPTGDPGQFNWSIPESWEFQPGAGDHIYIVAWDDTRVTQMWIGEFENSNGTSLFSNTTDWEYFVSRQDNPGDFGELPSLSSLAAQISGADWSVPQASAPQGTLPWGTIPGIGNSAQFVWHDTFDNDSSSDPHYVVFRTRLPVEQAPVPEPATMLLMGGGLAGAFIRRKFKG